MYLKYLKWFSLKLKKIAIVSKNVQFFHSFQGVFWINIYSILQALPITLISSFPHLSQNESSKDDKFIVESFWRIHEWFS